MAVYWNLGLVTRTQTAAQECAAYFTAKHLQLGELDVPLEVSQGQGPDGWVVCVWPRGMSFASPMGNDPRLTEDATRLLIARVFDDWLRDAPPFAAGYFGGEAFDRFLNEPVSEIVDGEGLEGLVVDEETWISIGRPERAQQVGPRRFAWPRSRVA